MARLRSVPVAAERAIAVIRVSKERDGMIAPEVQWAAIESYAAARGYEITDRVEGLDESGSRAKSAWWPRLDQCIARVEAGEADVLLVWKFSRTARHRLKWALALDRVDQAGGRIESATEQVDVTTSTGRFTRGMLGELNAFEAERIGEVWKEVHARRIREGRPASGKARYGYSYDAELQLHVPDPVTGPLLAQLYRRYNAGESLYSLVRWLNAHGHRTQAGAVWATHKLRRVLDAGFGAGKFTVHGVLHDGIHEPVIDAETWQAYLDNRARRRAAPAQRERSQYLLSGLVRCARCGSSMVASIVLPKSGPQYRCKANASAGPTECRGGYVLGRYVEETVHAWLVELAGEIDETRTAEIQARAHRATIQTDAQRLARQLARAEEALARLAVQHAESPLPPTVYRKAHAELTEQITTLTETLEDVGRDARRAVLDPARVARGLLADWDDTPVAQRRQVLETLIKHVAVTSGRSAREITVVPIWEGPEGK